MLTETTRSEQKIKISEFSIFSLLDYGSESERKSLGFDFISSVWPAVAIRERSDFFCGCDFLGRSVFKPHNVTLGSKKRLFLGNAFWVTVAVLAAPISN